MESRTNRRGYHEHFVKGGHLKLKNLKDRAPDHKYLSKTNILAYPRPVFHVSRLKHDTDQDGLMGIKKTGGFMNPYEGDDADDGLMLYFSLFVGPEEIESAEERLLKTKYPDRTSEQIQNQQSFLQGFASSQAFQQSSMYGSYRFTLSVTEVLDAYKEQFCGGDEPVMRVMKTVLYKKEVVYMVLVHSPANQAQFSKYPLLAEKPNPICGYKDGCFKWKSVAMCGTHSYELVENDTEKKMEAIKLEWPLFYVWDHVIIAFHVDKQPLIFDVDTLKEKLSFCEEAEVTISQSPFQSFTEAQSLVKQVWSITLMRAGERAQEVPQE